MERERKRLEQFRRLRKEIRGSQDYLVVGIDISKDTRNALMRNTSGKILYRRLTFNNTGREEMGEHAFLHEVAGDLEPRLEDDGHQLRDSGLAPRLCAQLVDGNLAVLLGGDPLRDLAARLVIGLHPLTQAR